MARIIFVRGRKGPKGDTGAQGPAGGERVYAQTITVALSGGDFTDTQAALDSITDSSDSKQYLVLRYPGTEGQDYIPKPHVTVQDVKRPGGKYLDFPLIREGSCATNSVVLTTTTNDAAGTTRWYAGKTTFACKALRAVFANYTFSSGLEVAGANVVPIKKVSIEVGDTIYPVTISGSRAYNLQPGRVVKTDALDINVDAGEDVWIRVYWEGATGPIPAVAYMYGSSTFLVDGPGKHSWIADDYCDSGEMPAVNTIHQFAPVALLAKAQDDLPRPSVLLIGASSISGTGDNRMHNSGFIRRALNADSPQFGIIMAALSGETCRRFIDGNTYRMKVAAGHVTHAIIDYGRNDLGFRTAQQIIDDLTELGNYLASLGIKPYICTIRPYPTCANNTAFTNLDDQTPSINETDRVTVNTWIRTCPSAYEGVIDAALAVEPTIDSGKWGSAGIIENCVVTAVPNATTLRDSSKAVGQPDAWLPAEFRHHTVYVPSVPAEHQYKAISDSYPATGGIVVYGTGYDPLPEVGAEYFIIGTYTYDDLSTPGLHASPAGHARMAQVVRPEIFEL